jgi:hypothetical protein
MSFPGLGRFFGWPIETDRLVIDEASFRAQSGKQVANHFLSGYHLRRPSWTE